MSAGWTKIATVPLSFLYRIIVFVRNIFYDNEYIKPKELDNNIVISVGNLSVGGTGKTPLVELIADYLLERGKFVVVVLKGYKREQDDIKVVELGYNNQRHPLTTENFGDEAFLYLANLEHKNGRGLIIVGDNKTKSAKFVNAKFKPEIIIIDDGFQHRKLARDLDIVILNPDSDKHLIPAGTLREPARNIHRADLVVVNTKFSKTAIIENTKNLPRVICSYEFEGFLNIKG